MENSKKLNQQELFAILNGRLSMIINRYMYGKFRELELGITVEQWTVLACLWQKDKVTQQSLSDITFKDKPSITRLIDNLEKGGLVVRVPDRSDRRAKLIHLTQKGVNLEQKATEIVNRIVEKTMERLSDEEILVCRNVLRTISSELTW